jgi:DNA-directed RNA polymerase specialized sigma24 family protein
MQPFLGELLVRQQRILGMIYRDRLSPGDVGPILGMLPEEVRPRERDALKALFLEIERAVGSED